MQIALALSPPMLYKNFWAKTIHYIQKRVKLHIVSCFVRDILPKNKLIRTGEWSFKRAILGSVVLQWPVCTMLVLNLWNKQSLFTSAALADNSQLRAYTDPLPATWSKQMWSERKWNAPFTQGWAGSLSDSPLFIEPYREERYKFKCQKLKGYDVIFQHGDCIFVFAALWYHNVTTNMHYKSKTAHQPTNRPNPFNGLSKECHSIIESVIQAKRSITFASLCVFLRRGFP